ncbi:MAG TPA: hypothetical protein VIK56_01445 [Rhodoferax sp.]
MEKTTPGSALTALKFTQGALSPEQQRFNKLLAKTETLARNIETTRALADTHRRVSEGTLRPLEGQRDALMRDMVLWLDERLKRKGLTAKQKRSAAEILCGLAAGLAMAGDEVMQQLHDAHSDMTMAEQEKAETAEMHKLMENMLGQKIGDGQSFDSMQDMMQASLKQMDGMAQDQQAQEDAHAQAHAAHMARRKKTPSQQKAEQEAQDADGALRTIYRQLVSALHPDRESDPHERERKTGLMKDVNAAYERRDLMALLQLQLRAALADGEMIANMAREKIAALTLLLKERVLVLTHEMYGIKGQMRAEFGLAPHEQVSAPSLKRCLQEDQRDLQDQIAAMSGDLHRVQDDAEFKRWLREQTEMSQDDFDPFGDFDLSNPFHLFK